MARKWKRDHPDIDPSDPIHEMTRSQQTITFRLRTGHNRLRQHMYKRFKVGDSEICPCGQAPQNTEHVLQACSSHRQLRARTWPNHSSGEETLRHNGRTCPDSALHCGIGSHCLTDSCRKNEEEEEVICCTYETLRHNGRTCPDSGLLCGIGSHCLTDSCRKNEEEEEEVIIHCVSRPLDRAQLCEHCVWGRLTLIIDDDIFVLNSRCMDCNRLNFRSRIIC